MFGVCGEEVEKQDCIPQTVGIDGAGKARQDSRKAALEAGMDVQESFA